MALSCGIIGLPNAGKSTLFNALTSSQQADTGNYPFCTIDANKGQVLVPDERLEKISKIFKPQKVTATSFEWTDIAGLVKGASQGEGLGNQFLSHIRAVDSLLHVVRIFKDSQVTHVYGEPDPLRDIQIINTELVLSDWEIAEKRLKKIEKTAQTTGDKTLKKEMELLKKVLKVLGEDKNLRDEEWSLEERAKLKAFNFISLKPVLYVCNIKEEEFSTCQERLEEIKNKFKEKGEWIAVSCAMEAEMTDWTDKEKSDFLNSIGLKEPALHTVIKKVYEQLSLISFFTAGEKEVRAWTVPRSAMAPQAGGVIHSDFEKGFIRAHVYSCEDLFQQGSENALKEKGLIKTVGKEYQVQDGDIMHFLFNN